MRKATFWLVLLLLPVLRPGSAPGQEPRRLPDDVAAIVRGEIVTMAEFRDALVLRYGTTQEGAKILENMVNDMVVEAEQRRRGIAVTEAEIDAHVQKTAAQVFKASAGTKTLDKILADQGVTAEEFRKISRDFLVRQKMAAVDLGVTGEVRTADLALWMEGLKRKAGVVVGTGLPAGAHARVGDRTIGSLEFGKALLTGLPPDRLESALWDLAIARAVHQQLKSQGVVLDAADVDRAIEELEIEFRQDPRFAGTPIKFEQYIQTVRNLTLEDLKKDPAFLAQVGLGKSIRAHLSGADLRDYWSKNRDRYGEERTFVHLLIRGEEKSTPFGRAARPMAEAKEKIDRILDEFRRGASFDGLLKQHSEARSETVAPEQPISVTRDTPMPDALREAVFSAPAGEVLGPIRTSYGYHLVKVLTVHPAPTYEEVEPRVVRDLVREERSRALLEIRQDPNIILRY